MKEDENADSNESSENENETGKYDRDDAAEEHDSSIKEVTEAWHDARDDSGVREAKDAQHFEKAPLDGPQTTESGISLYPEHKK